MSQRRAYDDSKSMSGAFLKRRIEEDRQLEEQRIANVAKRRRVMGRGMRLGLGITLASVLVATPIVLSAMAGEEEEAEPEFSMATEVVDEDAQVVVDEYDDFDSNPNANVESETEDLAEAMQQGYQEVNGIEEPPEEAQGSAPGSNPASSPDIQSDTEDMNEANQQGYQSYNGDSVIGGQNQNDFTVRDHDYTWDLNNGGWNLFDSGDQPTNNSNGTSITPESTMTPVITAHDMSLVVGGAPVNIGAVASSRGNLTYESHDTSIVLVDQYGNAIPRGKVGRAIVTIRVSATDSYAEASKDIVVTVNDRERPVISMTSDMKLVINSIADPKVTVTGGDAKRLQMKTSDESVVRITAGNLTAVKAGTATITATLPETENAYAAEASMRVTVMKKVPVISAPERLTLALGQASAARAGATVDMGNLNTIKVVSDNPKVARVDEAGRIFGSSAGTAQVTLTLPSTEVTSKVSRTIRVTVSKKTPTINISKTTLTVGQTASVVLTNAESSSAKVTSNNPKVAGVRAGNQIAGVGAGSATISVTVPESQTASALTKTFRVKVNKATNPMTAQATTKTASLKKIKSKAVVVTPISVKRAQGTLKFIKAAGAKCLSVNAKTGKVTIAKGTKKGTYKATVKVTAQGNSAYSAKTLKVSIVVKVK